MAHGFAGLHGIVITVHNNSISLKANELGPSTVVGIRFIQQRPVLVSDFAGFAAILLTGFESSFRLFSYKSMTYKFWG